MTGPYVFNFVDIYEALYERHSAFRVATGEEIFRTVHTLIQTPAYAASKGEDGYAWLVSMRGATEKNARLIIHTMDSCTVAQRNGV
jgi:3-deoxy-D-manno-octulosonic-acid transferase